MKLKFNLKYCLLVILIIVLLYSVLGNNVYEGLDTSDTPTKPGCYMKRSTECARPDGNGGWKNGSTAGMNEWANYGYQMFPQTTSKSTPAELEQSKAAIAAGMSPADQATKCNKTGMLSWCSNSDKAVGKYPKIDWDVISIPYPKGTDYYTKPAPPPPTKPGCYTLQPTGCPNDPKWKKKPNTWVNDGWGKAHDKNTKSVCMDRTQAFNTWCGVSNTKMHWNAPVNPATPPSAPPAAPPSAPPSAPPAAPPSAPPAAPPAAPPSAPPAAPPAGTPAGTPGHIGPRGPQGLPGTDIHHKTRHHLGGDTDKYGCIPSAGEFWCNSKQSCIQHPTHCPKKHNDCGEGTFWDKIKQACLPHSNKCGKGTVWNKEEESCVPYKHHGSRSDNPTDDNYNYHDNYKSNFESGKHSLENDFESGKHDLENEFESGKHDLENEIGINKSNKSRSQIPSGQGNQYMLKSQIVPPVCPACPPVTACGSNKKQQPCPGCARCPEPAFDCKKVPNYNSTNTQYLPKPLLNDFSQF